MLNKLFWIIILFIIFYILLVFRFPSFSSLIDNNIGVKGTTEYISGFKKTFDKTVTNIPNENEVKEGYDSAYSGAINFKDKFIDGAKSTKGKIDSVREKISTAKNTYNDLKDGYSQAKEFIDDNSKKLDALKSTIDTISEISK